jgi:hypothetical protein
LVKSRNNIGYKENTDFAEPLATAEADIALIQAER